MEVTVHARRGFWLQISLIVLFVLAVVVLARLVALRPGDNHQPSPPREPSIATGTPEIVSREVSGRLDRVIDGDTIVVDGERVRLAGINAPEIEHAFPAEVALAEAAKRELERLLADRHFSVVPTQGGRDRYGRLLADVRLEGGDSANEQMLLRGFALVYRSASFPERARYEDLERLAREKRRGLWSALCATSMAP